MNILRILITGSRDYSDHLKIERVFKNVMRKFSSYDSFCLVSGACPTGADNIGEKVASELGWQIERYPADWSKDGKAAGPIRNQRMVDTNPDICLAFPLGNSRGTYDCIKRAKKANINTKIFNV